MQVWMEGGEKEPGNERRRGGRDRGEESVRTHVNKNGVSPVWSECVGSESRAPDHGGSLISFSLHLLLLISFFPFLAFLSLFVLSSQSCLSFSFSDFSLMFPCAAF